MPIPQFISQIFDFLEDLASSRPRLFPAADRGLGTVHISADTANDGRAPGATDLIAVAGNSLSISFPRYERFREGSTITLVPPPGFRFVDDQPGVEVGAISRYFDADSPNVHSLPGIPGTTILTGDGRIVWEAREAPSERYLEHSPLLVTFGKDKPLWIQPESGVDADKRGGPITLETTAVFSGAYTISYGLGEIILDPGVVSLTQSLVDADPPGIRGDGADASELVVLTLDDFGNPTERGVAGVELVRDPELGDLSAPFTYVEPGLRRTLRIGNSTARMRRSGPEDGKRAGPQSEGIEVSAVRSVRLGRSGELRWRNEASGCRYGRRRAAARPNVLSEAAEAARQSSKSACSDWSNTNSGIGSAWVGSEAGL